MRAGRLILPKQRLRIGDARPSSPRDEHLSLNTNEPLSIVLTLFISEGPSRLTLIFSVKM